MFEAGQHMGMTRASQSWRVAMPLTDAFGGHGGIALYNRDVLHALDADARVSNITAFPRIAGNGGQRETYPTKLDWKADAAGSLPRYMTSALWGALRPSRADLVWCAHVNLLPVADIMARLTGAPLILAIYGTEAWEPFERKSSIAPLKRVARVVSISEYTSSRFREWSRFPEYRTDIVANAIDLDAYSAGGKDPELEASFDLGGRKVAMIFGRMHPTEGRKGFDEMLEAWPLVMREEPEAVLVLAGDGGDRARLQSKAEDLGIAGSVRFTGSVPEEKKAAYYRLADAYVMPSRQEGFGFVHLEAMACGVPAVASKADGAREAVRDGAIGALVDPEDSTDIARQTLAAFARPRGIPEGLAHFAFPRFAAEISRVLDRTMDTR